MSKAFSCLRPVLNARQATQKTQFCRSLSSRQALSARTAPSYTSQASSSSRSSCRALQTRWTKRLLSSSAFRHDSTGVATANANNPPASEPSEAKLQLTFTCTVEDCSERSTHEFTRRAYERGIVLVTCPKCKNRHLIADHIGWFKETEGTSDGRLRTVEDLMRAKGEKVTRGRVGIDGVVEYVE